MSTATLLNPIFVGGPLRSGTTLLGSLIGADPDTVCLPESPFFFDFMPETDCLTQDDADRLFDRIAGTKAFLGWREQGPFTVPRLEDGRSSYPHFVSTLVRQYAAHVGKPGALRFVDHTPQNVLRFDRLASRFPNARFVHSVRDGRAVAASVLPLHFGPDDILSAAQMWLRYTGAGLAAQFVLGTNYCLTIHFEDLVRDPSTVLEMVANHCGLPHSPDPSASPGFEVPGFNRAIHALVGQAPDPARIDAWRSVLPARQVRLFEHSAGDMLRILGYEPDNRLPVRGPGRLERIGFELAGYSRSRRNRRREARAYGTVARSLTFNPNKDQR